MENERKINLIAWDKKQKKILLMNDRELSPSRWVYDGDLEDMFDNARDDVIFMRSSELKDANQTEIYEDFIMDVSALLEARETTLKDKMVKVEKRDGSFVLSDRGGNYHILNKAVAEKIKVVGNIHQEELSVDMGMKKPSSIELTKELYEKILNLADKGMVSVASNTILYALTGKSIYGNERSVPRDGEEFRKCLYLFSAIPELDPHFEMVYDKYPEWTPFIENWVNLREAEIQSLGSFSDLLHDTAKEYSMTQKLKELSAIASELAMSVEYEEDGKHFNIYDDGGHPIKTLTYEEALEFLPTEKNRGLFAEALRNRGNDARILTISEILGGSDSTKTFNRDYFEDHIIEGDTSYFEKGIEEGASELFDREKEVILTYANDKSGVLIVKKESFKEKLDEWVGSLDEKEKRILLTKILGGMNSMYDYDALETMYAPVGSFLDYAYSEVIDRVVDTKNNVPYSVDFLIALEKAGFKEVKAFSVLTDNKETKVIATNEKEVIEAVKQHPAYFGCNQDQGKSPLLEITLIKTEFKDIKIENNNATVFGEFAFCTDNVVAMATIPENVEDTTISNQEKRAQVKEPNIQTQATQRKGI